MPKAAFERPWYPIVYVRGYAGGDDEVEDTVADPYMGFNLGATKLRQRWEGTIERLYFESPLVRLMKDHGYRDVYSIGDLMPAELAVEPRSIFIYRYYDRVSKQVGSGTRDEIEEFAAGLSRLIHEIRERICADCEQDPADFRVYLVAHSMGGLICRCFLQNDRCDPHGVRTTVDKVFTYATPHNGIDLQIVGNVPGFFTRNNADNFNRSRMREYLALPESGGDRVNSLNGRFDPDRFFCLVGTNDRDYTAAGGWSRRVVGPMSDGLVRIASATVHDRGADGRVRHAPRAFVHRSHSGHFGIVNSEDGYQNLTRFLFGDVRVDGILEVDELSLPPKVERARAAGKTVRASYHFEAAVRVRRARWELHRRLVSEESAAFRTYDELFPDDGARPRSPHLFSAFLARWGRGRGNPNRGTLGFSIDLAVLVPDYTVDGRLWMDEHFEGGHLFRDKINLEAVPPQRGGVWQLRYGLDSATPNRASRAAERLDARALRKVATPDEIETGAIAFRIPVEQRTRPGMRGSLLLKARPWA